MTEHLALAYSDGSFWIMPDETLELLREQAIADDKNETDPHLMTRIVKVDFIILETIETPAAKSLTGAACPHCGKPIEATI